VEFVSLNKGKGWIPAFAGMARKCEEAKNEGTGFRLAPE
jgi:hypothetical protein